MTAIAWAIVAAALAISYAIDPPSSDVEKTGAGQLFTVIIVIMMGFSIVEVLGR